MRNLLFGVAIILLATSTGSAQTQSRNYNYYYNPIQVLNSEYLQKDLKLTKEQLARIKQINLQMEGVRALMREEIAKEVGLSDEQSKKVRGVYDDYYKRRSDVYKLFRTDRKKASEKYKELYKEYGTLDGKALEVLTKQQKNRFEKLRGEPFDRKQLYPRRTTPKKKPNV